MTWILIALGLSLLAWRLAAAMRVAADARRHGCSRLLAARWALASMLVPQRYWWGFRLELLRGEAALRLLNQAAQDHGLVSVANVRCPLCDAELPEALSAAPSGGLAVRREARCPRCDFRLDACRHCGHFRPAQDPTGLSLGDQDFTQGRCGRYYGRQPVHDAYPHLAEQLERLGYDSLSAPKPILDSYVPLAECTSYTVHLGRLRANKVAWLTRQRLALLRLRQRLVETSGEGRNA
jgi:hypothetical protein